LAEGAGLILVDAQLLVAEPPEEGLLVGWQQLEAEDVVPLSIWLWGWQRQKGVQEVVVEQGNCWRLWPKAEVRGEGEWCVETNWTEQACCIC
jgi:hypothetical protein